MHRRADASPVTAELGYAKAGVLDIGRKSRNILAMIRRAVHHRDQHKCAFPGCMHDRFIEEHPPPARSLLASARSLFAPAPSLFAPAPSLLAPAPSRVGSARSRGRRARSPRRPTRGHRDGAASSACEAHGAHSDGDAASPSGQLSKNAATDVATTQTKMIALITRAGAFTAKRTPSWDPATVPTARTAAGNHAT